MSELVFFNIWTTASAEAQRALIEAMREEAAGLADKRGFLSLTAWAGEGADHRVIVEGRWQSRECFEAAIARDPAAQDSRRRLEQFGQASPGTFVECLRVVAQKTS